MESQPRLAKAETRASTAASNAGSRGMRRGEMEIFFFPLCGNVGSSFTFARLKKKTKKKSAECKTNC